MMLPSDYCAKTYDEIKATFLGGPLMPSPAVATAISLAFLLAHTLISILSRLEEIHNRLEER